MLCLCKTSCRLSWGCTLKMCFHCTFGLARQSRPNRLGPFSATTARGSSSSWPWYCTLIISFPTTGIASLVYLCNFTSVGWSGEAGCVGQILPRGVSLMTLTEALVSISMMRSWSSSFTVVFKGLLAGSWRGTRCTPVVQR